MHWYYKDHNDTEFVNKTLKNNMINYIKYALGNLSEYIVHDA